MDAISTPEHNPRSWNALSLGVRDYREVYEIQKDLVRDHGKELGPDTVIFVEHPEVYTFGRKSGQEKETVQGIHIERGGESTYHNPGQLVMYPIVYLRPGERDLHRYLRLLEEAVMRTLSSFSVISQRREGATGVWVANGQRKIASVGVAVSSWVTYHGVALNVDNPLEGFSKIRPCGFSHEVMTSIQKETGHRLEIAMVREELYKHLKAVLTP